MTADKYPQIKNEGSLIPQEQIERYRARIAARIEMFRAVAAFEHAALRPLLLLNGGAAVALLAFIGQVWPEVISGTLIAMAIWSVGLALATIATSLGYFSQNTFYKASGHQFEAEDANRVKDIEVESEAKAAQDKLEKKGHRYRNYAHLCGILSVICFVAGAWWALYAFTQPAIK